MVNNARLFLKFIEQAKCKTQIDALGNLEQATMSVRHKHDPNLTNFFALKTNVSFNDDV